MEKSSVPTKKKDICVYILLALNSIVHLFIVSRVIRNAIDVDAMLLS